MQESRSSARRTRLIGVLLGVLLLALLGLAVTSILVFPAWLHPPLTEQELAGIRDPKDRLAAQDARRQRQDAARATLLQGVGALLVFTSAGVGAYFTWRQVRHNREQLEVARQGQVTERFTRAVDQLGSDQLDIRLGGIYALERIARDSETDRTTIAEILTAYIRQRSPWPPTQHGQYKGDWPIDEQPDLRIRGPDLQAALTVLGRGSFSSPTSPLDLREVDLRKADLVHADLHGADLFRASLEGAKLIGADLTSADLGEADLAGADLTDAKLGGADLTVSDLTLAFLINAHLEKAILSGVSAKAADLTDANLKRARLNGADLEHSTLVNANLTEADLIGANLTAASLDGANLTAARFEQDGWQTTRWPEGFDWRSAGAALVDGPIRPASAAGGAVEPATSHGPAVLGDDLSDGSAKPLDA